MHAESVTPTDGRAYYAATLTQFRSGSDAEILGTLAARSAFSIDPTQRDAWQEQITLMRNTLSTYPDGYIAFEFAVPRVGRRIDVLLIIRQVIFVLEFKVGEQNFKSDALDQVWDYALDLRNFHSTSHDKSIAPVLIATRAQGTTTPQVISRDDDGLVRPIATSPCQLAEVLQLVLVACEGNEIDVQEWLQGRYTPTPTIIEAAMALYGNHSVKDIARSDASAINLSRTSDAICEIIDRSKAQGVKSICFVTGVPGAGKTLVGLNIATQHIDKNSELYSVYLSGNGPLVAILREALARDKIAREKKNGGRKINRTQARSEVRAFIQAVHNFRDDCLVDLHRPPVERIALFDEAQRAWTLRQTASFMLRKKKRPDFDMSEPEFLLSCLGRHEGWALVVCLVGGGQEINTGEAGIGEWIRAVKNRFSDWHVYLSPNLHDSEYAAGGALELLQGKQDVSYLPDLHLGVSMRSFRAENVSALVKHILDADLEIAKSLHHSIKDRYPIVLTRDIQTAKSWLKSKARGTERFGILVSSQAQRLKPLAIDIRASIDPIHWFLDPKEDVRSSFYLEDVASEFHVQGLELDWSCVVWDGDFRRTNNDWQHWSFKGSKWQRIRASDRQAYLKNAYRVLLTRARQGMAIVVPHGDASDPTRSPEFYDETYDYLKETGLHVIA